LGVITQNISVSDKSSWTQKQSNIGHFFKLFEKNPKKVILL
jgi:hypothetical protein